MRSGDDGTAADGSRVVAILAVPRAYALDVSIPAYVFGQHEGYRVLVCGDIGSRSADHSANDSADHSAEHSTGDSTGDSRGDSGVGPPHTEAAIGVRPTHSLAQLESADIVVVPGYADVEVPVPDDHVEALRLAVERGARTLAICTGVFALAASGTLNGKSATTHWRHTDRLRATHPEVDVVENQLFVEDGALLTSAGAGSGIDACLHVIRTDFGATAADDVAKDAVSPAIRGANEPQYADRPPADRDSLRATREWAIDHLGTSITVQRMAAHSLLSRRTFIRRFTRETGMPPMRWVAFQRILSARRLLETSDLPVERIAAAAGFGTSANFRAVFRREMGMSPSAYRKEHDLEGPVDPVGPVDPGVGQRRTVG
ncbi:GlxA family transcriptional regulator [Streptomyces profundus]|uniref:GlxA family transcriptional regulator n=1 Tax=Streptomyces profundus TaxID=2867410 RepID=UPI001D15E438|nr:helix-turn-helix domain-containing protein [Streptomyces sp. MA3_2.13]